jgi:quercetin dioxygenase-like cupin family protein
MLVAKVSLKKGCHVQRHHHPSEQMSVLLSGRVLWTLGEERRQVELTEGQMLHIPGDFEHEVVALEDTEIVDILSPPAAMGVDSQGKA